MNIFDLLSHATIPIVILILGIAYKSIIADSVKKYTKITIKLPGSWGEIKLDSKQAGKQLTELFNEFYETYNDLLNTTQIELFEALLEKNHKKEPPPSVEEMIPDFNRTDLTWEKTKEGKEKLGRLRALRGFGLIEPAKTRQWQADSKIKITPFGKALTVYMKK